MEDGGSPHGIQRWSLTPRQEDFPLPQKASRCGTGDPTWSFQASLPPRDRVAFQVLLSPHKPS